MFVMKVWLGSRNIVLTRLGREESPVTSCLVPPAPGSDSKLVLSVHWLDTVMAVMFAHSIYINKTIVSRTLQKNYGRFINQENFPPKTTITINYITM